MLASVFLRDGIDAALHPDEHVEKFKKVEPLLEKAGLPPVLTSDAKLLARVSGALTAIAAAGLAIGKAPRACALLLAVLNFPITVVNNPVWAANSKAEKTMFSRGLVVGGALTGGLGMAVLDTQGKPSWRYRRAIVRETKANMS